MNEVVALERNEVEWLRNLRAHVFSAESEVTALRRQYREALALMRQAVRAHEANDPIRMRFVVEDMRDAVMGE